MVDEVASVPESADMPTTLIDVEQIVGAMLSAYGPVPVTERMKRQKTRTICQYRHAIQQEICFPTDFVWHELRTANKLLSHGDIEIVKTRAIEFGTPSFRDLPEDSSVTMARAQNCQSASQVSVSQNVTVTVGRSASISVHSSITRTIGTQLGFSYPIPNAGASISGSINLQRGSTHGKTKMDQESAQITRSTQATVSGLPEKSAVGIAVSAYKIGITAPFTAEVVIDADLSRNDKGLKRLSDIVDPNKRTFLIRGSLNTNSASQANVVYYSVPFSQEACHGSGSSYESTYIPPATLKLLEFQQ